MTPILSPQKQVEAVMSTDNPLRDQSRAIREQHETRPAPRQETPKQARIRMQIEREQKQRPMTGGK